MENKLPDSFVVDRRKKEYPTEIGSQNFSPDNIELFKLEKTNKLKHHFTSEFSELQKKFNSLMDEINLNERLYKANHNFQPIPGQNYYLYQKESGEEFLSIISPNEWKNKFNFIGSYELLSDGRWIDC